jgi:hypothetical protein
MDRLVEIRTARHSSVLAIVVGGFLAGTIDIGAAALINSTSPVVILKFIAGGLLGRAALAGGALVAILGFALQVAMSLVIAALYVVAAGRWLPVLLRRWLAGGLAYGVVVFFVMNYAVVPLSAWAKWPRFTVESFAWNMLAMLVFGVIVAGFARYYSSVPNPPERSA